MIAFCSALLCCAWASADKPQVAVVPEPEPLRVFAGPDREIRVVLRNPTAQAVQIDVRARLYQLNSATAVRLSDSLWKRLRMLPRQTVVETAPLSFPEVKAPTRFVVRWVQSAEGAAKMGSTGESPVPLENEFSHTLSNRSLGTTEVLVHPPDLLKGLKSLAGSQPLGVFDPEEELKPLLRRATVDFQDMEDSGLGAFQGALAIVGPFKSKARLGENLATEIASLAKRGAAIVWIQPPPERSDRLRPSFSGMPLGNGTVVVVQAGLVSRLAEEPQSQLNLIELARQAMHPAPARLPDLIESSPY